MKKVLIVSDNEFINLLYVLNLEVYLAVNTTLVLSSFDAIMALRNKMKFDLILTLETVKQENSVSAIEKFLKSYGMKIPIIAAGASSDELIKENIYGVTEKFNIQRILKTSAKILEITAKQMAELDVGAYYPISVLPLIGFSNAPCPIFFQSEGSYKSLVKTGEPIGEKLSELEKAGTQQVFVNSKDRLTIINQISLTLMEKISHSLNNLEGAPVEKKVQVLNDGFEFAAANLFGSEEVKKQILQVAMAATTVMQNVVKESSNVKGLMAIMLSNRDGYIFTHSIITSYVAYHMIKNVTWGGEGQVEKINFVLFFHDIYLAPIYLKHPELKRETALLDNPKLSDTEKETILEHARFAAQLVVDFKRCPMGADVLIKQHHGMKKGRGFASFYAEDLSPLSKILTVAEVFVEELLKAHDEDIPFSTKVVIPKLIELFNASSYTKIIQTLVNVPI